MSNIQYFLYISTIWANHNLSDNSKTDRYSYWNFHIDYADLQPYAFRSQQVETSFFVWASQSAKIRVRYLIYDKNIWTYVFNDFLSRGNTQTHTCYKLTQGNISHKLKTSPDTSSYPFKCMFGSATSTGIYLRSLSDRYKILFFTNILNGTTFTDWVD